MTNDSKKPTPFAQRILDLRKQKGWSQPELGKKIGTSGAIIGRYERSEITPSIDVARKLADTFGVTLDFLIADRKLPNILQNKEMLSRLKDIDSLPKEEKDRILSVVDSLIRDAKARQAYALSG